MPLSEETNSQAIKLDDKTAERLRAHVTSRFKVMKAYRDQIDTAVTRWIQLYNCVTEKKDYDWQSNLFVPYTYTLIQTLLPRIRAGLFGAKKIVSCEAQTAEFLEKENKIADWFEAKLRAMKFKSKMRDVILESLKYPMGIVKIRWNHQVKEGYKRGFLGLPFKIKETIDTADIDPISWFDFWYDPDATNISNARDVIHRVVRDFKYLKVLEKAGLYYDIDKVKGSTAPTDIKDIKQECDIYDQDATKDTTSSDYQDVELLEYWGKFDLKGDGKDVEIVCVIANREILVRADKNRYWGAFKPFEIFTPLKEDNQFTGMPSIKIIESPQEELNTVRNQRLDNVNLILRKLFKVRRDADIDLNKVFSGPGHTLLMDDMEDIQEFPIRDVTQTSQIQENMIVTDMKQALGVSDYWMGSDASSSDTARGMQLLTGEMATRVQDMIENLSEQVECLFTKIMLLCKQYIDSSETFRTEEKGAPRIDEITYKELQGSYLFKLILKTQEANTTEKQAMWVQLLNVLGKFKFINVPELVRGGLESFDLKNIDKIMDAEKYAQEIKAQMAQAMMAQGQNPAGMPPEQLNQAAGMIGGPMDPTAPAPALSPSGLGPLPGGPNG